MLPEPRIGLAFGGGAARGLAHLGVLSVFEKHGIPIDIITGTSMGAIIGAMYAVNPHVDAVRDAIRKYLKSDVFKNMKLDFKGKQENGHEGEGIFYKFSTFIKKSVFYTLSMTKHSFISQESFMRTLAAIIPDVMIEDAEITFGAIALDLHDGTRHVFTRGDLRTAIASSCALPGIVEPLAFENKLLVDGGWIEAVPVRAAAELGADITVGVDISGDLHDGQELGNSLDVAFKADKATRYALAREVASHADCIISPHVAEVHWADFSGFDLVIERGRQAAETAMPSIKAKIVARQKRGFWARMLGK